MPAKRNLKNLFQDQTEPTAPRPARRRRPGRPRNEGGDPGAPYAIGTTLDPAQVQRLEEIAAELEFPSRHQLQQEIFRLFLEEYDAHQFSAVPETIRQTVRLQRSST